MRACRRVSAEHRRRALERSHLSLLVPKLVHLHAQTIVERERTASHRDLDRRHAGIEPSRRDLDAAFEPGQSRSGGRCFWLAGRIRA